MHTPLLNWIELSQKALRANVASLHRLADGCRLALSVKANAYGHGLAEIVGQMTAIENVEYLTIHSMDEALACRRAGWDRRLIVLGPIGPDALDQVLEHDLEPTIFDLRTLKTLGKISSKAKVSVRTHLKLETGTNRQGITGEELPGFVEIYRKYPTLGKPYGAATHFANIEDTTNHDYAELQLAAFRSLIKDLTKLKMRPSLMHTASSAATILFAKTHFDMVRPGLSVYGHWPSKETYLSYRLAGGDNDLFSPVLSWKTRVTQIKKIARDSYVGYGCTYRTTAATKMAVIPIGYADGYDRGLSNTAYALVRGQRAPVRGRVCMNLAMIDITHIKGVRLGDAVTLIGRDGDETLTAEQLADWSGTINYEILSRLSPLIPRIVVE
jgi:alanine racemase